MTRETAQKRTSRLRHLARAAMVVATVSAALATMGVAPASATTAGISGTLTNQWDVTYYNTARTNTQSKNAMAFKVTGSSAAGGLCIAIRPTSTNSGTYARGCGTSWTTIRHDNGNSWVGPGTFYLSAQNYGGACGGSGCGAVTWTADLQWNVLWF